MVENFLTSVLPTVKFTSYDLFRAVAVFNHSMEQSFKEFQRAINKGETFIRPEDTINEYLWTIS